MRIIGGKYKGRLFHPGKKFSARPTTDIAREGLFNILENRYDFSSKKILDLFAGTGSISYEFLSRGCEHATLVELNFSHYKFIREVVKTLKIENVQVFRADVFKFMKKANGCFNIIFADPPFDLPDFNTIPNAVFKTGLLHNEGVFILEHPKEYDFSAHPNFSEIRKYGKVNFSFFENRKNSR